MWRGSGGTNSKLQSAPFTSGLNQALPVAAGLLGDFAQARSPFCSATCDTGRALRCSFCKTSRDRRVIENADWLIPDASQQLVWLSCCLLVCTHPLQPLQPVAPWCSHNSCCFCCCLTRCCCCRLLKAIAALFSVSLSFTKLLRGLWGAAFGLGTSHLADSLCAGLSPSKAFSQCRALLGCMGFNSNDWMA